MKTDPAPASNNQIKEWKKLLRGKNRKIEGLFLAEGIRCVEQIIENNNVVVRELLVDNQADLTSFHFTKEIPAYKLTSAQFLNLSDTESPQGVIAVCEIPEEGKIDKFAKSSGVIVAIDAIQDPGNLGTIIRTAAWFGVSGIIFGEGCVDPFHPKVVRSTAGATGSVPFLKGNLESIFRDLESSGWHVYLLDGSASASEIRTVRPGHKSILVAGNEGNGIRPDLFGAKRSPVRIDGNFDTVESLNVAVALGIGLFTLT
tara:strand:- start:43766 stop:44539 length:774 start_codon:yes stop_codon:yes gene_type:complete